MSYKSELPVFGIYRCMIDPAWQNQLHELVEAAIDAHANFESQSQLSLPISGLAFSVARSNLRDTEKFHVSGTENRERRRKHPEFWDCCWLGRALCAMFCQRGGTDNHRTAVDVSVADAQIRHRSATGRCIVGDGCPGIHTRRRVDYTSRGQGVSGDHGGQIPAQHHGQPSQERQVSFKARRRRLQLRDRTRFVWPMASLAKSAPKMRRKA